MDTGVDVFYLTYPLPDADHAISLTEYLNQHGITAVREDTHMVVCPLTDPTDIDAVHLLRKTWERFWEYSDSTLFGLPVYFKP